MGFRGVFWIFRGAFWDFAVPFGFFAVPFGFSRCLLDFSRCLFGFRGAFFDFAVPFGISRFLGRPEIKSLRVVIYSSIPIDSGGHKDGSFLFGKKIS